MDNRIQETAASVRPGKAGAVIDTEATERLMGRYVTVCPDASEVGDVYRTVAAVDGLLLMRAAQRPRQTLQRGARVQCVSVAGLWHALVEHVKEDEVSVRLPDWAARSARRKHRRVPSDVAVELHIDGKRFAGRLVDISLGGASMLMERLDSLHPGLVISVRLPPGDASAMVSSVRAHHHPSLRVVGVAWMSLDSRSAPWVGRQVAAGASSIRRRQAQPDGPEGL